MNPPEPLYAVDRLGVAYQLHWAISLFPTGSLPDRSVWWDDVAQALEGDGIRFLESPVISPKGAYLFWVSTLPVLAPAKILQRLKGRIQYAVREEVPRVFQRNYRIDSAGSAGRDVIQEYVTRQPRRHRLGDPRLQEILERFQIRNANVDLSRIRYTSHGQFIYNLHVVLEHAEGWCFANEEFLKVTNAAIKQICLQNDYLLARGGIVADHLHLTLGCGVDDTPNDVGLSFLNGLATAHRMQAIYRPSYYAGTFGNYHLGALHNARGTKGSK